MARKLPWAATSASIKTRPASPRPQKRIKTEAHDAKDSAKLDTPPPRTDNPLKLDDATPMSFPTPRKPRPYTRNLSSSPPPPAPPEIDALIPGLDADDAYMMVEDEFYATAQSFTAHLHHAEYKRLMREAREKKKERGGVLESHAPGDATRTVKDGLRRRQLERRQRRGIGEVVGGLFSSDPEDEELEKEEERVGDLWAGTSLAPLMRRGSSGKVSLKGLEKISGATRAARGFGPSSGGERSDMDVNRVEEGTVWVNGTDAGKRRSSLDGDKGKRAIEKNVPDSTESAARKRNGRIAAPNLLKTEQSSWEDKSKPDAKPVNAPSKKHKSFIDSLDDFDADVFDQIQAQTEPRPARSPISPEEPQMKRENKDSGKKKGKKDRSARYDEIPIFLV